MGGILIIGAGAAGYFAAIAAARAGVNGRIVIAESGAKPLRKVAISGGGRCNVTHSCFDPAELIRAYPRGDRELRGPFSRFQPKDTVDWFETAGVKLKTEPDGRIFPVTDSSQTIIDCLERERIACGAALLTRTKVVSVRRNESDQGFSAEIEHSGDRKFEDFAAVVIASGSSPGGYQIAAGLGHAIVPCVPSLFTFKVTDARIEGLAGNSVEHAILSLEISGRGNVSAAGPLLITHWGFSGPAVIRLSAWAARPLAEANYRATLRVSWVGSKSAGEVAELLRAEKAQQGKRLVDGSPLEGIPKRLWAALCRAAGISESERWATLRADQLERLGEELCGGIFQVIGKGEFKDEFVTCGGVELSEVDFRRMESKIVPGLFFAGEVLDIDGITGGFNFQSAWTTGWIAGNAIAGVSARVPAK